MVSLAKQFKNILFIANNIAGESDEKILELVNSSLAIEKIKISELKNFSVTKNGRRNDNDQISKAGEIHVFNHLGEFVHHGSLFDMDSWIEKLLIPLPCVYLNSEKYPHLKEIVALAYDFKTLPEALTQLNNFLANSALEAEVKEEAEKLKRDILENAELKFDLVLELLATEPSRFKEAGQEFMSWFKNTEINDIYVKQFKDTLDSKDFKKALEIESEIAACKKQSKNLNGDNPEMAEKVFANLKKLVSENPDLPISKTAEEFMAEPNK